MPGFSNAKIKVMRLNHPLLLIVLLPLVIVVLAFVALMMLGSMFMPSRNKGRKLKAQDHQDRQVRNEAAPATKASVIEAEYHVVDPKS